ncbi:MAG: hypothetical protein JXR91_15610 [Deltaproteobacteria bacterium]|nr:hypothetical protein [Deltaproteobacteria bacterium]
MADIENKKEKKFNKKVLLIFIAVAFVFTLLGFALAMLTAEKPKFNDLPDEVKQVFKQKTEL